jgi:hypothetical protein
LKQTPEREYNPLYFGTLEIQPSMKLFITHLKESVARVVHDRPGQRFINHHEQSRHNLEEHPVKRVLIYIIAFLLIGAGFVFGFVPGIPGIILGVPGLVLIAGRSKYFALMMDRAEMAIRKFIRKRVKRT